MQVGRGIWKVISKGIVLCAHLNQLGKSYQLDTRLKLSRRLNVRLGFRVHSFSLSCHLRRQCTHPLHDSGRPIRCRKRLDCIQTTYAMLYNAAQMVQLQSGRSTGPGPGNQHHFRSNYMEGLPMSSGGSPGTISVFELLRHRYSPPEVRIGRLMAERRVTQNWSGSA